MRMLTKGYAFRFPARPGFNRVLGYGHPSPPGFNRQLERAKLIAPDNRGVMEHCRPSPPGIHRELDF